MLVIQRKDISEKTNKSHNNAAIYINYNMVCALNDKQEFKINLMPGDYIIEAEINNLPTKSLMIKISDKKDTTVRLGVLNAGSDNAVYSRYPTFTYHGEMYLKEIE